MKLRIIIVLILSHAFVGGVGFFMGIYTLPILTAPVSPTDAEIKTLSAKSLYKTEFTKHLKDSDALHWGEGKVSVGENQVTLKGAISPGPDFKLYLSPKFVETESEFKRLKNSMKLVGNVETFDNFAVKSSSKLELEKFNTVIVWCESFGEFITSAKYR